MGKSEKPDLMSWLGLRSEFIYGNARWLGGLISVFGLLLVGAIFFLTVGRLFYALLDTSSLGDQVNQSTAIRNYGLFLAAIIGVPFLIWRSIVAQKQVDVAEQGQITDRINKAVQGLGAEKTVKRQRRRDSGKLAYERDEEGTPDFSKPIYEEASLPNLEVRVGSIYALERIAQDSDRDHIQIMEILCAYIRENAPAENAELSPDEIWSEEVSLGLRRAAAETDGNGHHQPRPEPSRDANERWASALQGPRTDIRVALEVIGRRSKKQIALERNAKVRGSKEGYRLDLRGTCLQKGQLTNMGFEYALFDTAQMQKADLTRARLQGASFSGTQMQLATLEVARIQHANFYEARMQGTNLIGARMQDARFVAAQMEGANLGRAQMLGAIFLETQMQGANFNLARMEGAKFVEVEMQGATFYEARLDDKTKLITANLRGAALKDVDFSGVSLSQKQVDEIFGDSSVDLHPKRNRPDWPLVVLDDNEFETEWRAWQKKIGYDPPEDTP